MEMMMTTQSELVGLLEKAGPMVDGGSIVQGNRNGHAIFTAEWQHARGTVRFDGQDWTFDPRPTDRRVALE
jgi:hypothetical protein